MEDHTKRATVLEISVCKLNSPRIPTSSLFRLFSSDGLHQVSSFTYPNFETISQLIACNSSFYRKKLLIYNILEHTTVKNLWERP